LVDTYNTRKIRTINMDLAGTEFFKMLKCINEYKPPIYLDIYINQGVKEFEVDFSIEYDYYFFDEKQGILNIYNNKGDLVFRMPFRKNN